MYSAKGVKGPWSNLGDISEGVHIWRPLVKNLRTTLGVAWMGSTHTDPDTTPVVLKAKEDSQRDRVFAADIVREGSVKLTQDVWALGIAKLSPAKSGTLATFHKRRRAQIIAGTDFEAEEDDIAVPEATRDNEFEHDIV
jgi:hypothetical protein